MSHPGLGVCRFYGTTNGCRYGNKCRYSHDLSESTASRGPTSSPGQSSSWRSRSHATTSQPYPTPYGAGRGGGFRPTGLPPNACQFYWTSGSCNRGFECSFRHVKGTATTDAQEGATAAQGDEGEDGRPVDFFSPSGLAAGAGAVRDDRLNLTPSEVHNHLKEFLRDDYRFDSAARIQGFVRVLASVSDSNKAWVRFDLAPHTFWFDSHAGRTLEYRERAGVSRGCRKGSSPRSPLNEHTFDGHPGKFTPSHRRYSSL